MNRLLAFEATICIGLILLLTGCGRNVTAQENAEAAPPPATLVPGFDVTNIAVDHPEQFPLATATKLMAAPELNVTGSINPDVSRQVPVPSLATGRVIEIDARPSDCIAMAAQQKASIYVSREVWEEVDDMADVLRKMEEEGSSPGESEEEF